MIPSSITLLETMQHSTNSSNRFKNMLLSKFYRMTRVIGGVIVIIQRLRYTFNLSKYYDPIAGVAGIVSLRSSAYKKFYSTRTEAETADTSSPDKWEGVETTNFKVLIVFTIAACLKLFEWIRQHHIRTIQDSSTNSSNDEYETYECQGSSLIQLLSNKSRSISSIPPPKPNPRPFANDYCNDCKSPSSQQSGVNKVAIITGHMYCSACVKNLLDRSDKTTTYADTSINYINFREADVINIYQG